MDCGIPFCTWACPVANVIPEWNDLVYEHHWEEALHRLHDTNNFPEFTGRTCPAPCEESCTLGIIDKPVTIKSIENALIEKGWKEGWVRPTPPSRETGKNVGIVGSGPAGLAAAQQLRRVGHRVTVLEQSDRVGGLLRYGIPDFKMEKWVIDRRMGQLEAEGVKFHLNCAVGRDLDAETLLREFDAVLLACGALKPKEPLIHSGRDLKGVHIAMRYLEQNNRRVAGESIPVEEEILATGKHVIVIGGGDTGSDCIGTANRQGAKSITQLQYRPRPPEGRTSEMLWPSYPNILRTSSSQEEGCNRMWNAFTDWLEGENGTVVRWHGHQVTPPPQFEKIPGSEFSLPADLVLIAAGYTGTDQLDLLKGLHIDHDERGRFTVNPNTFQTGVEKVFCAGDMKMGASLVVWAIWEGRQAAHYMDRYLMGESRLPLSPYITPPAHVQTPKK
jgi:glutamate synthase (NADPH/NADH) small chain